jgi:hypothetical protein
LRLLAMSCKTTPIISTMVAPLSPTIYLAWKCWWQPLPNPSSFSNLKKPWYQPTTTARLLGDGMVVWRVFLLNFLRWVGWRSSTRKLSKYGSRIER